MHDGHPSRPLLDGDPVGRRGDDPNEVDRDGYNALHRAVLFQRVLARIHDGIAGNKYGYTRLMRTALYNQLGVVIMLMNHPGVDLNVMDDWSYRTALHRAAHDNHHDIVSQLLSDDNIDASKIDADNKTALYYAIDYGQAECVTIFRQHGVAKQQCLICGHIFIKNERTYYDNKTAMYYAIDCGNLECVKILRQHKAPE
jgi:ankyrin repeat protein